MGVQHDTMHRITLVEEARYRVVDQLESLVTPEPLEAEREC